MTIYIDEIVSTHFKIWTNDCFAMKGFFVKIEKENKPMLRKQITIGTIKESYSNLCN
jgi:hypothetical protein